MPYLFSYGTLQQEEVQLSTFGRRLVGAPDSLIGYVVAKVRIEDSEVVATSGKEFHPIARKTGAFNHRVPGTVLRSQTRSLFTQIAMRLTPISVLRRCLPLGRVRGFMWKREG